MSVEYDLKGKVAIVTGGGRGIGKSISMGLARCGAKIVVASRTQEEIDAVVNEIKGKGGEASAVVTDLTVNEQIDNLVEATIERYQNIDILVNIIQTIHNYIFVYIHLQGMSGLRLSLRSCIHSRCSIP